MFTLTGTEIANPGPDQREMCGIETFKLYGSDGTEITADTVNPVAQLTKDYNGYIE